MKPNVRSFSGAALMLVIIPIFAGLLACMPVPVGDPERSRIDPDLNGVWAMDGEEDLEGIYLFQPWEAPQSLLEECDITLGSHYPFPIVEHKLARELALAAYAQMKSA